MATRRLSVAEEVALSSQDARKRKLRMAAFALVAGAVVLSLFGEELEPFFNDLLQELGLA